MGLLGSGVLGIAGGAAGQRLGQKYGLGTEGKAIGSLLGAAAGNLLPFRSGGKVKKTGPALLHKGELVIPKKYVKDVSKSLKTKIKKNGGRNM